MEKKNLDSTMESEDDVMVTEGEVFAVETQPHHRPIISGDQLDVKAYAALYSGRTKIQRLFFIVDNCGNESVQLEALRMSHDELKKGENTDLYRQAVQKIGGRLGPDYEMDSAWVESVDLRAENRKEKLENKLSTYRTELIKESIRMGYSDLGDFHYACGSLQDAFKNYARMRECCTNPNHVVDMCLNAILVAIEMGQFSQVASYVSKAEASGDAVDAITGAKLKCAAGLASLSAKNYKHAARKFLEVVPELGSSYSEVLASQDVARYGGLLALACFERAELKRRVIDNLGFRNFLELVPEIREAIQDFYASRYASCLDCLEKLKPNLLLDGHLHKHVEALYEQIRSKAIIQYTYPFVSVDLQSMADAFKTTVSGLERELEALITQNQIQARIDSHNKVLYARHADQRKATFQKVLQMGGEFDRDVTSMLLRASVLRQEQNNKKKTWSRHYLDV